MEAIWYTIVVLMIGGYVVLDGFDFGAGALSPWVAKSDAERRQVLAAIGPFWDGNEVWLLASGGVLFLAFPRVLASGLSGFYLAIMLVLWVLILRGLAIELRSHLEDRMWRAFWDLTLAVSSTLAPVLLGAALGHLIRGVPLRGDGWFELSFFESFSPRGTLGILDWYTVASGVLSLVAILHHGALFLAWKAEGPVRERSRRIAAKLYVPLVALWALGTLLTAWLVDDLFSSLAQRPLAWAASALLLVGLAVSGAARRRGRDLFAFLGSGAFLLGVLGSTAASIYPTMIRSIDPAVPSLTALDSAADASSLAAGLRWWPVGIVLVIGYYVLLFRLHSGRVRSSSEG